MESDGGFDTVEEAALEDWPPEANATVTHVHQQGDAAIVRVDTEPSHPMNVYCERRDGRWFAVGDSTA